MEKDVLDIFYEDWDGEMVLSDVRNFKDEKEFLEKAETYVGKTRGYRVPVLEPQIIDIKVNDDGEWANADSEEFEGEKITVYVCDLDWENNES